MIHLAIVGTGNMGDHHARTFKQLKDCTLIAACDIEAQRVRSFADTYAIPTSFTDVDEMLKLNAIDAVVIATPDHLHAPITLKAVGAGKHVLCEKPLAVNYPEAESMRDAAQSAGVINMINFSYRAAAALQDAHQRVAAGDIGRVVHFEARYLQSWLSSLVWGDWQTEPMFLWRLSSAHGSQGVLGDIGVHILDFTGFVAGEFASVNCRLKTFPKAEGDRVGAYTLDANDSAVITAELTNGALGVVHVSRWATGYENALRLEVHGDKGALIIDLDASRTMLSVCSGADVHTATWKSLECPPTPINQQRFLDSIRRGKNDQPDFARGAAIQKVIDACFDSDRTGRTVTL